MALRSFGALLLANGRYWLLVAPDVKRQLGHWRERAAQIPDAGLRSMAIAKLHDEGFNAQVAATLATLAPRQTRTPVIEAIVALEVMYDFLDGVTELDAADPLTGGRSLFRAFVDAVSIDEAPCADYYRSRGSSEDGGYLAALSGTVRTAVARLPSWPRVAFAARDAAARCAEAQVRANAAPREGLGQLRCWGQREAPRAALNWRQFLAGAVASVLCVHALIVAAADAQTTGSQAAAIGDAYLPVAAVSTMLDSLVDHAADLADGASWHVALYHDTAELAANLNRTIRDALERGSRLRYHAHHAMTLFGVIAYYSSADEARSGVAAPIVRELQRTYRPQLMPTMMVMRTWRAAKRVKGRARRSADATSGAAR